MTKQCYLSKPNLLDNIINGTITAQELNQIKNNLISHLAQPYETLETYHKKHLILKVMEHYPDVLDFNTIKEYTQYKVNALLNPLYKCVSENVPIKNNPMMIKMLINHMKGKEDSDNIGLQPQIVINTIPPLSKSGQYSLPEPKTITQDNNNDSL